VRRPWRGRNAVPELAVLGGITAWLSINAVESLGDFLAMTYVGVTIGSLYALVAIGYSISYAIIGLINLPHGFVFMIGVLVTVRFFNELFDVHSGMGGGGVLLAIVCTATASALVCGLLSAGIELVAYRPLRGAPRLAPLVSSVGVLFILNNVLEVWNGQHGASSIEDVLPHTTVIRVAGAPLGLDKVLIVAFAACALVGLSRIVQATRFGKALRAVAQDHEASALVGVNVNRTVTRAFFLAGALAGVAAVPYVLYLTAIGWDAALQLGLIGFSAAVVGGIGNLPGAALGGVLIGLTASYSEGLSWLAPGPDWSEAIVFAILILTLVVRPTGLLGARLPEHRR
jgi:branched-chain amino acid transport system permease protein